MKFCQQLSAYLRFKEYTGRQLYQDMFDQAILSDQGGYDSVGLTEHHLINILMMPAPLHFAVKIAEATKNIKIITKVFIRMSYEQVKSLLKKGISRPTLYEVSLPVISGEANRQLQFLCSAASVPEVSGLCGLNGV